MTLDQRSHFRRPATLKAEHSERRQSWGRTGATHVFIFREARCHAPRPKRRVDHLARLTRATAASPQAGPGNAQICYVYAVSSSTNKKRVVDWKYRRSPGFGHRTASGYTSSRTTLGGIDRSGFFMSNCLRAAVMPKSFRQVGGGSNHRAARAALGSLLKKVACFQPDSARKRRHPFRVSLPDAVVLSIRDYKTDAIR